MTAGEQALLAARPDFAAIAHWVKPGARVLDLGCGDGSLLRFLCSNQAPGYGVEIDDEACSRAWRRSHVLPVDPELTVSVLRCPFEYVTSRRRCAVHRRSHLREMLRVGARRSSAFRLGH